jgi:hypothetical protein
MNNIMTFIYIIYYPIHVHTIHAYPVENYLHLGLIYATFCSVKAKIISLYREKKRNCAVLL